jgi:radical SAM superfamily enzyme YgiQ (UPF0313 family)
MLDLLLITEEAHSSEYSKFNRHFMYSHRGLFQAMECTAADAEAVRQRYGLETYLVNMEGRSLFGSKITEAEYLPIFPHRPSLALCDLATVARDAGYETAIIDNVLRYPFRRAQMLRLLEHEKPRLVGISTTLLLYPEAVQRLVASVREAAPQAKIVLGGQSVTRDKTLQPLADIVVFGSGEEPLVEILRAMDGDRPLESIPYIAFRDETGKMRRSAARAMKVEVGKPLRVRRGERIPVPDWTLYPRGPDNVFPIEFSRGCKYNCYYCAYDRGKNVRPLADIREELLRNAELGITKYRLADSNFTDGPASCPDFPYQVCRLMKELDLGLQWSCYSRVDDLTPELAQLMREAGCFAVFFGIESGDDDVMRLMRKGHTVADARRGMENAKRAGLHAHSNFIIGYPGETRESARRTVDFILDTRPDTVMIAQFYLEENAPVSGPRMASFGITGSGNRWKHATMDSDTADRLILDAQAELAAARLSLGSEFTLAERMSLGLSFEDCRRQYDLAKTLFSPQAAGDSKALARDELRKLYLERIPAAIAREQSILARAH